MTTRLTVATEEAYLLGEGPFWDPVRERVLWVDIQNGDAFSAELRTDGGLEVVERVHLDETVGAVAVSAAGDWIIAGRKRILVRTADGRVHHGPRMLPDQSTSRLNDGKPDPAGRYLVGTLSLEGSSTTESLFRLDDRGAVTVIDADLTLANGLAWTGDGRTLYSVDTERRIVFRRAYDAASGITGPREEFVALDDGAPDGITIDAEDHVWIAVWGRGEVHRYSPDGALAQVISIPAPHTSSVAFAGPQLETLVVTTAMYNLSEVQLAAHPLSGHVFTVTPGVRGRPQSLWNGRLLSASADPTEPGEAPVASNTTT